MHHQRQKRWRKPEPSRYEVPRDAKFVGPWVSLTGEFSSPEDDAAVMLEYERLVREFVQEYPQIAAAMPEVVARRFDTNEILFHFGKPNEVKAGGYPFAVVSLTWSGKPETDFHRHIEYFEDWSHFECSMARDAADPSRPKTGNA